MPGLNYPARVSIEDVARHAGVSIATVSRVLNSSAPVAADKAERVRRAVAELNYVPNIAARGLASSCTQTLGLLLAKLSAPVFVPLLRGIESAAQEAGFSLLISALNAPARDMAVRPPLGEHNTDGLLVYAGNLDDRALRVFYDRRFPVVLMHQFPPEGCRMPSVNIENRASARRMVEHLLTAHGRRRIAFLRGPDSHPDSYWREQGYRDALAAYGLPYDGDLVGMGGFDQETTRQLVARWLAEGRQFDALFADDESALGAIQALRQAGYRIPQDVAVVGFDDVDLARHLTPPLTTVRVPIEAVGFTATRQLIRLIQTGEAESVVLPTEPVFRQSCGCMPYDPHTQGG